MGIVKIYRFGSLNVKNINVLSGSAINIAKSLDSIKTQSYYPNRLESLFAVKEIQYLKPWINLIIMLNNDIDKPKKNKDIIYDLTNKNIHLYEIHISDNHYAFNIKNYDKYCLTFPNLNKSLGEDYWNSAVPLNNNYFNYLGYEILFKLSSIITAKSLSIDTLIGLIQ